MASEHGHDAITVSTGLAVLAGIAAADAARCAALGESSRSELMKFADDIVHQ